MTRKSVPTNANPFLQLIGTSRPKPKNGGRHGQNPQTDTCKNRTTQNALTTRVTKDKAY